MDRRLAWLSGLLLLGTGFAVLVLAPAGFSPVQLFGGLALLIAVLPFLVGAIGTPPAVDRTRMAAFLTWYAWRYSSLWVRVGPQGVSARQYLRTVSMRWDQVVALTTLTTMRGLSTHAIWSERDRITFYAGGLDGAEELAAVVAEVAGLECTELR